MADELPNSGERFRDDLLEWGEENRRDYPWRNRDRSFYEVFVAEFFLTQTPADNVARVYPSFLNQYPSLVALRESNRAELEASIEPLGFQRMRTEALTEIAADYDTLPQQRDDLLNLPRVGDYVADATLCFACERPLPIVDRNVVRTYKRVFEPTFPESPFERRAFAKRMVPDDGREARLYNLSLLDFGALVCQKRNPRCKTCFASDYCSYYKSTQEE